MSKTDSPVDVLITMPFGTSLIKPLQEVAPTLRITVHPAQNVNEVPDELWKRCEVLSLVIHRSQSAPKRCLAKTGPLPPLPPLEIAVASVGQ